jgi:hypothetical protein
MRLVLFIPDFVLADKPEVLRASPVRIDADLCRRVGAAVERCHAVTEASSLQRLHICADKDPTKVGIEASPEAMAVGFIRASDLGESRLEVRRAIDGALEHPVDTIIATTGPYGGAFAGHELREAFLHNKCLPKTTDYTKIRFEGLYGVLINLRLSRVRELGRFPGTLHKNASNRGVGIETDQVGFAVGLPLYDAAGHVIDLRRYSVLGGIGRDGLKSAAELLNQLALGS